MAIASFGCKFCYIGYEVCESHVLHCLLHMKQGATVLPATGKDQQFKIMKGSIVYYLRTISQDCRQAWLDAIDESIRVYNSSLQKAAGGAYYGKSLVPQQSEPSVITDHDCSFFRIIFL
jgi:hypothetical protein